MKTYYFLNDINGYGSDYPVCVDRATAESLYRGWNCNWDGKSFEKIWHKATAQEIAKYGKYNG